MDAAIDGSTRAEVIEAVLKVLNDSYVYPEVARKVEQAIRDHQKRKGNSLRLLQRTFGRRAATSTRAWG
jgi:hypothetical protein